MESELSYDELLGRILADDEGKWDALVEARTLRYENGRLRSMALSYDRPHAPTPWAQAQLCEKLRIPAAYFKRCPKALQDAQFNHWVQQIRGPLDKLWLVRGRDDIVRGVLSELYAPFDNLDLLRAVRSLVGPWSVSWFALSGPSMHLRLVDPRRGRNVLPDDRLIAGVHIANSEIGARAVTVDALVYRLVCGNGLVRLVQGRSLLHRRHVGVWSSAIEDLEAAARAAVQGAEETIEVFERAAFVHVEDPESRLTEVAARAQLPASFVPDALQALTLERTAMQVTLYGLVNAATNAAQRLPADLRLTAELQAGELLLQLN
jgi:hypothetical protein